MSLKLTPWLLLSATTLFACVEEKDDTAEDSEPSDVSEPSDSEPEAVVDQEIAIDAAAGLFYHGYQGNDIVDTVVPGLGEEATIGSFSIFLMNSVDQNACILDWEVTADTTEANADFTSGSVADGFGGDDLETWYGFTVTSAPTVRADSQSVCDNMDDFGNQLYDLFMNEAPAFGYGPQSSLGGAVSAGSEDTAFAGILGLPFGEGGANSYFGLSQAYAYEITDGATNWDPTSSDYPQSTEIPVVDVPFAEGYYFANATSLITWAAQ